MLRRLRSRTSPAVLWGLGMFGVARLATLFVAWIAMAARPDRGLTEILTEWDGNWNEIATTGLYQPFAQEDPASILRWRTSAFFPVLPLVTRGIHEVSGVGVHVLGPLVSMFFGAVAFALLGSYLFERVGRDVALGAMALMLFSPNGFVLSMFYTEGLMILFTVLTLRRLDENKWWQAGIFAALGGLTRPSGFVLVVPCLVEAVRTIRRRDAGSETRWSPIVAVLLAPLGFVSWVAFVAVQTGSATGYFRIQSQSWGARVDMGATFVSELLSTLTSIRYDLDVVVSVLAVASIGIGGTVLAIRQKLPATWIALSAALVVVTIVNARQASGARFILPAFPLFVAWTRAVPKTVLPVLVGLSAAAMGALFLVSTTYLNYTP